MEPRMKRNFFFIGVMALFLATLPLIASWSVCQRLENRLNIQIEGRFVPVLFAPVFYLKDTQFEWNRKVRFEKGDLKVAYEPLSLLSREGLRVRLSGKDLKIRLLGDWARMQGVENADLEKFRADFSLGRKGLNEIYCVEAESKAFQFHLEKSENKSITG